MINRLLSKFMSAVILLLLIGIKILSQSDSAIALEAVTVEAYQMRERLFTIPGSLSLFTARETDNTNGTNLASLLNTLPGVSMQSGTYTTNRIVIRGMGSRTPYNTNRIRSYLNDIPLTTSDGISTPEEIDLLSMGRVELVKGPSSALYGSGLGGSINLYTPSELNNGGFAGLQYGSFNTAKINLSGSFIRKDVTLSAGLGHLQSEGYRENSDYKRTTLLLNTGYNRSCWSLSMNLLLMSVHGGIPSSLGETLFLTDPQAAAPSWKAIGGYKAYTKGIAGITLTNKLSDHLINRLTLFGRANDQFEKRPFNNLDDRTLSVGVRNKLTLHRDKTDWIVGVEGIAEEYAWRLDTNDVTINQNREMRNQLNVFAIVYYRPGPKVNISVAGAINYIRYRLTDVYDSDGDQSGSRKFPMMISPRFGINYTPGEHVAIYASAGHGFSMPSPEETLLPEGNVNPDIKPEQGLQFEVGSRLNLFHQTLDIDATLYWIELKDLLVTKRISEDIFTGINAGKTRHLGFEFSFRNRFLNRNDFPGVLNAMLTYTNSLNRFIDFTDEGITYDGNNLPGIPDQVIFLQVNWNPITLIMLHADMGYTGNQFLEDGNAQQYNGYILSNLKIMASFQVKKAGKLNAYFGINNLNNAHYASMLVVNAQGFDGSEPRYYYPGLPRHIYAGISISFK